MKLLKLSSLRRNPFFGLLLITLSAYSSNGYPQDIKISANHFPLNLKTYASTLSGTFYFGTGQRVLKGIFPYHTELIALNSEGKIDLDREFSSDRSISGPVLFRELPGGQFFYALGIVRPMGFPGYFHFLDASFREVIDSVTPPIESGIDVHDLAMSSRGSIFYLFNRVDPRALTSSTEIQEWQKDGKITFSWNARERVPEAFQKEGSFDNPSEINSVAVDEAGDLLVGFRDSSQITNIHYPNGKIIWQLTQKTWEFPNDEFHGFRLQHCVRWVGNDHLLLFDNGDANSNRPPRAVEYEINPGLKTAKLVWEYRSPFRENYPVLGGSVQRLSNGNTLIGWGTPQDIYTSAQVLRPLFTEVSSSGKVVRELVSELPLKAYQIYFKER